MPLLELYSRLRVVPQVAVLPPQELPSQPRQGIGNDIGDHGRGLTGQKRRLSQDALLENITSSFID